jgi:pimeloyl-ACP methyl ester carboxylesterase
MYKFLSSSICAVVVGLIATTISQNGSTQFSSSPVENANLPSLIPAGAIHTWIPVDNTSELLSAWIFVPTTVNNSQPFPVVVLSHGIGSQKDMGLSTFAQHFALKNVASVVIDYRTFGGSKNDWKIRNYINPWHHVDDIVTTVKFIQSGKLNEILSSTKSVLSTSEISLWGTSFGGGHVIMAAEKLGDAVKCVVSQVPHMSGRDASKRAISQRGVLGTLKLAVLIIADYARNMLGLTPLYIKIVGSVGEISYMALSDYDISTYYAKHPTDQYLGTLYYTITSIVIAKINIATVLIQFEFLVISYFTVINCRGMEKFVSSKKHGLCELLQSCQSRAKCQSKIIMSRICLRLMGNIVRYRFYLLHL